MAQDPEADDPQKRDEDAPGDVNTSHDLDMVTLYESQTIDSEMEAGVLKSLLESNGVPAIVVGATSQYPVLGYQVQVPRAQLEEARRILADAQAAGPEAAAEAEAESEKE